MGVQSDALEVEAAARFLNILLMNHFLFCFPLDRCPTQTNIELCRSVCVFWEKNMEITLLFGLPTIGLFFSLRPSILFSCQKLAGLYFHSIFPVAYNSHGT